MPDNLAEQIQAKIKVVEELFYRLVLVVGPSGTGKTAALQSLAQLAGFRYLNVNLELSQRMLDLTQRQRTLQVRRILDEIIGRDNISPVLLDNTEVLFDENLKQDPLMVLKALSRQCTIVASWNGSLQGDHLIYARPGHPEHQRYSCHDLVMVSTQASSELSD